MPKLTDTMRLILLLALVLALVIVPGLALRSCQEWKEAEGEARLNKATAEAGIEAGVIGLETAAQRRNEDRATDETVKGGIDAVQAAEGAQDAINPAIRNAAKCSACQLQSYYNSAECARLRQAGECQRPVGPYTPSGAP
ncbi:MAG TPA: hypothetical protein PKC46_13360 [Sphingorhabdus sp.]|nr:hypothetical protein [Sphingorhabdus sp.]